MEISLFKTNIKSLNMPKEKKSITADNLRNFNKERIANLSSVPRVFFEPLFLQDPDKLKKYIAAGEEKECIFYNKETVPVVEEESCTTWEIAAIARLEEDEVEGDSSGDDNVSSDEGSSSEDEEEAKDDKNEPNSYKQYALIKMSEKLRIENRKEE
jgi:hypothetical protein